MKIDNIKKLINDNRIIFLGDVHGNKSIPETIFNLIKDFKKSVFAIELPKQPSGDIIDYFENKLSKEELFQNKYLKDALNDNRLNANTLDLYKKLYDFGFKLEFLEDYENKLFNGKTKDKFIAEELKILLEKYPKYKIFLYAGNIHTLDKPIRILLIFKVKPIKYYLNNDIKKLILTIQFSNVKEITYNKENNTVYYTYKQSCLTS
ncbi:hypothetical protein J4476_03520 [Candidatus Woesearchaeota archaeon]|nr:MAG: hypothetical protein QT09_C0006G0091 [archaeon GW2011_AR18]MBS3161737.1 hypothetical protein [Candidatus Woesearchaeota archaeon]HIH26307.1 hypothetical protein [Nanoarchaeota archaeon]